MQKKPIYLWILLVMSALISAFSLFGILSPVPSREDLMSAGTVSAGSADSKQVQDLTNYLYQTAQHSHSLFNIILVIVSAILVVLAFVFLVRQQLQFANYAYVGYVLTAIIGLIYGFMGTQDAVQVISDQTMRLGTEVASKVITIIFIVINVLFLVLVFYKMWRQQKALAELEEDPA